MVEEYHFCLYIAGKVNPNSLRAIHNLRRVLEAQANLRYTLEIVDVLEEPERAEVNKIKATPTLEWYLGQQRGRLVGDFSQAEKLVSLFR
ncbi:MAG: circadian clock KaiB family protein [Pseudanabaenaceae cyanobacterium SKYGB_i_bin29]|nr:circadian clock protein KaiB [Pseudanabaenaceae cyanobacterium SKYG29]MDW8421039.1 circadian clock KaiB family protein [Pseudanabaenaceae cyanobacterium SKYGB_i_bin29]